MTFETWLAFCAASIALLTIPGPTIVLVTTYALTRGRHVALATAAGVVLGDLVAMTVSLLGLGALILASATLFQILKWIGAAYLIYLGVKLLHSKMPHSPEQMDMKEPKSTGGIFWHAMAVTALNPKSIVFFIAFVPQFVDMDASLMPQFALLTTTFVTLAGLNALTYALAADQLRRRIRRPGVMQWMNRAGGTALIGMGAMTAALQRS